MRLVTVVNRAARRNLYIRFRDPETGQEEYRSAKTHIMRDAERAAARWEDEILAGQRTEKLRRTKWTELVTRFKREHLAPLREATDLKAITVLESVTKMINPIFVDQITSEKISEWLANLREPYQERRVSQARGGKTRFVNVTRSESTIDGYRAVLYTVLKWATEMKLLKQMPTFPRRQRVAKRRNRSKVMKGRPINEQEFELLLSNASAIVGEDRAHEWIHLMTGIWLGSFRLEETLEFWWDRQDKLHFDFSGKYPMIAIPGELEKAGENRLMALAPDFVEYLETIPIDKRTGPVFPLTKRKNRQSKHGDRPSKDWVSSKIVQMGRRAGIIVDVKTGKTVSAQDLRRSFGSRWCRKVKPKVLQEMMRHESIETTMRYYVEDDAQETAEILWSVSGNHLGNRTSHE